MGPLEKADRGLVSADGRYESLQKKMESFKINNLNAKEIKLAGKISNSFAASFISLCWKIEGLSLNQLAQMTAEELQDLDELYISKKALRSVLLLLINPFLWPKTIVNVVDSYYCHDHSPYFPLLRYRAERKRLIKLYGKIKYFPADNIMNWQGPIV